MIAPRRFKGGVGSSETFVGSRAYDLRVRPLVIWYKGYDRSRNFLSGVSVIMGSRSVLYSTRRVGTERGTLSLTINHFEGYVVEVCVVE